MKIIYLFLLSIVVVSCNPTTNSNKNTNNYKPEFHHNEFKDTIADFNIVYSSGTMVTLVIGQSNAANFSESKYTSQREVYNYYHDTLYYAKDPILGASGKRGSVWTRLGDMLIDSNIYKKVVFIPLAIDNTSITNWAGGDCVFLIYKILNDLKKNNIKLTHILWHQGERDNELNTSKQVYKNKLVELLKIFRDNGQDAPFYVSIASYTPYQDFRPKGFDSDIQNAQHEFIDETPGVFYGPNTDSLTLPEYRYEKVHFSDIGIQKYAELWFKALKNKVE